MVKPKILEQILHVEEESNYFLITCLLASWLGISFVVALFGFFNLLYFPLFGLLVFPIYFLFFVIKSIIAESWQGMLRFLVVLVAIILGLHFLGVLVPETGFDAIWYHLPVLDYFRETAGINYDSQLYQTANPLLSDLLFYPGFQIARELGTKLTAYLLGLSLLVMVYQLARQVLNKNWTWLLLISVLLIQPVAWQFSSFYVDVAKAFWEVSLLWLLIEGKSSKRALYGVGLLLGASVATKAFSVLLVPVVLVLLLLTVSKERGQKIALAIIGFLTTALPFYLYIWFTTGSPFTSILIHLDKLQEIGGNSNFLSYLFEKIATFPLSWWQLFVAQDYISILVILFAPLLLIEFKRLKQQNATLLFVFILFSLAQWVIWWFVPPLSTRYTLAGFIVLMTLLFWAAQSFVNHFPQWKLSIFGVVAIAIIWHLLPRLIVSQRSVHYLIGNQTRQQYLRQFYDGSIDHHLQNWQQ